MLGGGGQNGFGTSATVTGSHGTGWHDNSSDEEILQGMQGRFENGRGDVSLEEGREGGVLYTGKSIQRTTVVDVSYQ